MTECNGIQFIVPCSRRGRCVTLRFPKSENLTTASRPNNRSQERSADNHRSANRGSQIFRRPSSTRSVPFSRIADSPGSHGRGGWKTTKSLVLKLRAARSQNGYERNRRTHKIPELLRRDRDRNVGLLEIEKEAR
jgi:hypothetical protein